MYAYFKLSIDCPLGQSFNQVWQQRKDCEDKAFALAKELGGGPRIVSPYGTAGGGLIAVEFKTYPDMKAWKGFRDFNGFYSPRLSSKEGRAIKDKMKELPIVEPKVFNELVGFKPHSSSDQEGRVFHSSFVFHSSIAAFFILETGLFYLNFNIPPNYEAPKDLTEITVSEYKKVYDSITPKP